MQEEEEWQKEQEVLEEYYFDQARKGIRLSAKDLAKYAAKRGLAATEEQVESAKYKFRSVARYTQARDPPQWVGTSVDKLGNIMVDMAEFGKNLAVANGQAKYFLVAVDCLSQKLAAVPCANKNQATWEAAILLMVRRDFDGQVTSIITDRDTAVAGLAFQTQVRTKYGIDWYHLYNRSKSFRAERQIRTLKTRLSAAMEANGDNKWVVCLQGVVDEYNSRFVTGTKMRRDSITKMNYMKLVGQKYKTRDPVAAVNLSGNSTAYSDKMKKLFWKYQEGQRVLVAKKVNYLDPSYKSAFHKPSVEGYYSGKVFLVEALVMKSNGKQFAVPTYRLRGLKGLYYEQDLIPALFSGEEERAGDARDARRAKYAQAKKKAAREAK
jgi:PAS domain-containing protein